MKTTHEKFLLFNGKNIVFLGIDGTYWIPLKPICEALNIDTDRSIKNVKKDTILGAVRSEQTVQVIENDKNQGRNMMCLPEKYIYGWIFSLRSDSEQLQQYKKTCYELLYNHFHGQIGNRKELLLKRSEIDTQIHEQKELLKDKNTGYKILRELENERKQLSTQLNSLDTNVVNQTEMEFSAN